MQPELKPCVRISATYPASDGSMPENVEVVWETDFPNADVLCSIVDHMVAAPAVARARADKSWREPIKVHLNQ